MTYAMPALMTMRLHMEQQTAFWIYAPEETSLPTRYSVESIILSRGALMMAFASACTLRQSSYRSPRGICSSERMHLPRSVQFFLPRGAPT